MVTTHSQQFKCRAHRCVSQRELRVDLKLVKLYKRHTCTHQDVQPHYEVLVKKNEQFTHQKVSSTALVNFTWSPGNLPSRTGAQTHRGRAHAAAPRSLLTNIACFMIFSDFFSIFFLYSGPESVSGSPQAAAELWGGKHCGSVTSGHFHKLFFFFFFSTRDSLLVFAASPPSHKHSSYSLQ